MVSRDDADAGGDSIPKATLIRLDDPIPPSLRKKSKTPVKKITFGGSVETKVVNPRQTTSHANISFEPTGRIWKALKEILTELKANVPPDLLLKESLAEDDLRVSMSLSCNKKKSETSAGELLAALGQSLSHADADFSLTLADNTVIKGDKMKVGELFGIECVDHHPVHESLFKRMIEYMTKLVENETIAESEAFGNTK